MCDNGYDVILISTDYDIRSARSRKLSGKTIKIDDNVYVFDDSRVKCCMRKLNESWLWNRRMGHENFDKIFKIRKTEVIRGLSSLSKLGNIICKSCCLERNQGGSSRINNI